MPRKPLAVEAWVSLGPAMTLAFSERGNVHSPGGSWSVLGERLSTAARWANKNNANLDVILASKEELVRGGKIGCRGPEIVGCQHPRGVRKQNGSLQRLDLRGADLYLF